jgi:hypothetical protein
MTTLLQAADTLADYRAKRATFLTAADKADAAFDRYWDKLRQGQPTNAAQACRLSDLANYASADFSSAQGAVWGIDLDSQAVDKLDGIEPLDVL